MENLRQQLDEGKLYYFVSWMKHGGYRQGPGEDIIWIYAQGVINRHPFEFIKDQHSPMLAVLLSWKEITEEEYYLYAEVFNHP
jgi:hypothetical protein